VSTTDRREREKAQRREDILRAAREVLASQGFGRATIDDVAAHAQVSKGTVYLYFTSKGALLAHLVLEGLDLLARRLETAYAPRQGLSAFERVRRLARAYLRFSKTQHLYFRLLMAFDRGQFRESISPELYQQVSERSVANLLWVERALEAGQASGEFVISDVRRTAGVLWASLNGVLLVLEHPLRQEILGVPLDELFDSTLELLLHGLDAASLPASSTQGKPARAGAVRQAARRSSVAKKGA